MNCRECGLPLEAACSVSGVTRRLVCGDCMDEHHRQVRGLDAFERARGLRRITRYWPSESWPDWDDFRGMDPAWFGDRE